VRRAHRAQLFTFARGYETIAGVQGQGDDGDEGGGNVKPHALEVRTHQRTQVVDITTIVREAVRAAAFDHGLVHCFVPHTTAALTLNENHDPKVLDDLVNHLERLVPWSGAWTHQGNAAAHIKASMLGHSIVLAVDGGEVALGHWQGLFLCDFHGPRARTIQLVFQPG
jgi:secondary thiamine-phosphate synthase enzyme